MCAPLLAPIPCWSTRVQRALLVAALLSIDQYQNGLLEAGIGLA